MGPKFFHTKELCYEQENGEVIVEEVMSKEDAQTQFREWAKDQPMVTGRIWDKDPTYMLLVAKAEKIGTSNEFTARVFNVEESKGELSKVGEYLN